MPGLVDSHVHPVFGDFTPRQRTVVGTLATLPQLALAAKLAPPTLIIIGEVVRLHAQLAWYE